MKVYFKNFAVFTIAKLSFAKISSFKVPPVKDSKVESPLFDFTTKNDDDACNTEDNSECLNYGSFLVLLMYELYLEY